MIRGAPQPTTKPTPDDIRRLAQQADAARMSPHGVSQNMRGSWVTLKRPRKVSGGGEDESKWSFGFSLSGATCHMYTGNVIYDMGSVAAVSASDVTLTGATAVVHVRCNRAGINFAAGTFEVLSAVTPGDATYFRFPIATFTLSGSVYTLTRRHHRGDVIVPRAIM